MSQNKAKLAKLLGLDDTRIKSIAIRYSDDDIPMVTVETYPIDADENYEWIEGVEKYRLVPREEDDTTWGGLK